MAVNLSPVGGVAAQFFNNDGTVLSGGKLNTYTAGTTTPAVTYTTSAGSIAHSNPIVLNSAGRVPASGEIWLTDGITYKFVLTDANDVLIATYDNISGINSNFINFTNEQEIQTATAGQTVFTLTTMQYQPGTGSLSVFVDGVNQYGPGAQYAFTETSGTVVTFVTGLHVGASVKFTTSAINAASYGNAFQISYTPPFTGSVATNVGDKLAQTVSIKDFGAVGDSVTDDTNAIQAAIDHASTFNKAVLFPEGQYAITQIDTKGYTCTWYFEEAELLAIATTSTTCAVRVRSFNSKFYGMKVNLNNKLNYGCAIWWYDAAVPSQYNSFFGLTIMQAWRGLVYGEFPGNTSTSLAQSENSIYGFQCYGVWQPLIMNHLNGVLVFSAGQFISSNDTWGVAFDNTNNFAFIAYAGCLTLEGCEVQNSIAATTSYGAIIQGGEVYLNGCITEFDVPFQLSGLLTINGGRVINTRSDTDMFYIGAAANAGTKLKVNNCYIYRAANVGSFSARYLVNNDGSSQNIQIMFNDCDIIEWASFVSLVRSNNQSSSFNNCRWFPDGTQDAFYGVYNLDTVGQNIIDLPPIDTRGYTTDGFYVSKASGTSTMTLSADVPNSSFVKSISVNSTNTGGAFTADGTSLTTLKATAFRTVAKDKFLIEAWIRYVSGGSNNARLGVVCYDSSGALLGTAFIQVDNSTAAVSSAWNYVRGVLTIPTGSTAAYVGFGAYSSATEVRFCGVKVRRSNWNMV